ncbi:MAG: M20/M25/M40 family metallo-hydrolase [Clostridia bacterium]|nr:M20/M25/M40 family metallo-hydrolase [Clostridia bacterium]
MKANESVKNYPSERRMYANYTARSIKKVCKEIGPRFAGSEEEKKGIDYMEEELKTCCDEVGRDEYPVHPMAFLGWVPLSVVLMTVSSLLFFAVAFFQLAYQLLFVSTALILICLFFIVTEFLFYKETLDPFCKKKISHNAYGYRKASGETKRRIIFCGHADSSMEWRFTYWGGPKLVIPVIGGSLVGIVVSLICNIVVIAMSVANPEFISSTAVDIISYVLLAFVVVFLVASLFYDKKRIVEGANDDLTGCFTSIAMLKYLKDHDIRFENTEVWALCAGSEEIGLRGSKAFCEKHAKELEGVETVFVAIDTVRDFDFMAIYNKDMTGTVTNDPDACNLVKAGGAIAGYDLPFKTVSLGATDAAAVSKSKTGMKATAFAAMDPAPARYYHTRLDTHENLDLKTIEAGVDICLETMFLYDEKGLNV